jgi:hypothetical protein
MTRAKKRRKPMPALYREAAKYIERLGGKAIVVGGIQIIEWPADRPGNFTLGIRVMGRKPVRPDDISKEPSK